MFDGRGRIDPALETVAGIGSEAQAPATPGDRIGPPECRLDIHVAGVVRNCGRLPPHDAGQALHCAVVCDHPELRRQFDRLAIEQLEGLARTRPANRECAVESAEIEDMTRSAQFEHHVVGDVDQRGDRPLTGALQAFAHPCRSRCRRVHTANDATGEPAAEIGRLDVHGQTVVDAHLDGLERRLG